MQNIVYLQGIKDAALRGYYVSLRMCSPAAYYQNSLDLVSLSKNNELAKRQNQLAMPVLHIVGRPKGTGDRSCQMLTEAQINWQAIEPAGHWPFIDQQAAFVEEVRRFLNQLST